MESSKALRPIEQRTVLFYGDELTAVLMDDTHVYASIKNMCDALGLNPRGQSQRIDRHTILSRGKGVCKIHTPGGEQSVVVLRADLVPLWLSGVRTSMVNEDVRPKLEKFQEEAAAVLWAAFQEGRLTADPSFDELLARGGEAVEAYQMAQAIMKLARHQILLEARLDTHERDLADYGQRLEQLESQLGDPGRFITNDQASQISQAVKAVALALGRRSGRNEFGACYGELYRKFGITSYKMLPQKRFEEAMKFLSDWYQNLTDHQAPF